MQAVCKKCKYYPLDDRFWGDIPYTCKKIIKKAQYNKFSGEKIGYNEFAVPRYENQHGQCKYFEPHIIFSIEFNPEELIKKVIKTIKENI